VKELTFKRYVTILVVLIMLSLCACFVCLAFGVEHIALKDVVRILVEPETNKNGYDQTVYHHIILNVRFPRIVLAFCVGMALSVAGAVFQSLLRNPLAEPHLIGVSSGAALGAVGGSLILSSLGASVFFGSTIASFIGALIAISIIYFLSKRHGALSVYTLLLIGVILNSFFVSIIIFIESIVSADELAGIFSWLLGSLSFVEKRTIWLVALIVVSGVIVLASQAVKLNLLSLGEVRARALGLNVESMKKITYICASLITGAVVSVSGLIGFIGLVVPHISRMLFGPDHRLVIPVSACIGGMLLVIADTIARTMIAPQEIPVGVITSFLGAPFFIFLLKRKEARSIF
jgi:iron complex transport system permease protein